MYPSCCWQHWRYPTPPSREPHACLHRPQPLTASPPGRGRVPTPATCITCFIVRLVPGWCRAGAGGRRGEVWPGGCITPQGCSRAPGRGVRQCYPMPRSAGRGGAAGPHPAPSPGAIAGGLPLVLLPAGTRGQGVRCGQGQGRSRRQVGCGLLRRLGLHPHWPGALRAGAESWAVPLGVTPLDPRGPLAPLWPQTPVGSRRGFQTELLRPTAPSIPSPAPCTRAPTMVSVPPATLRATASPCPRTSPRCPLPWHSPPHQGAPPAARGAVGTPSG